MPTPSETHIENRFRVQPNHANSLDTLHGGNLMKWLDEVAAMSSMRFAGQTCVTAAVDSLDFKRPIPIGEIALVESFVYDTGRTSIKVALRAWRESPRTAETELTTMSTFTFVAVDDAGKPVEVPELTVETEQDQQLVAQANSDPSRN